MYFRKSVFISNLIKHNEILIDPPPQKIIFAYTEYQPELFNSLSGCTPSVEFHEGLPNTENLNPDKRTLIIFDDLMNEIANSKEITNLYIRGCHHRSISAFILLQNLYAKGTAMRSINLNSHYLVLFSSPRDKTSVMHLGRQTFPHNPKFLVDAFNQATSKQYGYLIVDLKPNTLEEQRLRTGILPGEEAAIFVPK